MNRVEVPEGAGSYRWYYVDASSGEHTVVAIFMIGSLFSPRYAASATAQPREHAAVNFAVYARGARRAWVLSEYAGVEATGDSLRIGGSTLRYGAGRLELHVRERTAPWGRPLEARVRLEPDGPGAEPVTLVPGLSHRWHPIAPRARAKVAVPSLGLDLDACAYHDGNWGDAPLGSDLAGWEWSRRAGPASTVVTYRPWGARARTLTATPGSAAFGGDPPAVSATSRTAWGLTVPSAGARLLESSPFYARLEAHDGGVHELGEVADFRRFRSPWIRWMARLRTRLEPAA